MLGLVDPTARGDRGGICLALVPGDEHLDLKALARATGDRRCELVPLREVTPLTGYIRGGVTALACKKDYPVFIDETAQLFSEISVSAGQRGLPVVASNDVRFLSPSDFSAHEARVCISTGRVLDDPKRPREYSDQQYLKSAAEMAQLFSDLPEALENSVELAKRCNLELSFGKYYLPAFPVPKANLSENDYIAERSREGLEQRLATQGVADRFARSDYDARLALELDHLARGIYAAHGMDFMVMHVASARFARGLHVLPGLIDAHAFSRKVLQGAGSDVAQTQPEGGLHLDIPQTGTLQERLDRIEAVGIGRLPDRLKHPVQAQPGIDPGGKLIRRRNNRLQRGAYIMIAMRLAARQGAGIAAQKRQMGRKLLSKRHNSL